MEVLGEATAHRLILFPFKEEALARWGLFEHLDRGHAEELTVLVGEAKHPLQ
ncbi:MAG: hypothetical protein O6929_09155 [candidate division NC10 bacterium]|nr:hypothetical protein [candidate division NC10 bacterium]